MAIPGSSPRTESQAPSANPAWRDALVACAGSLVALAAAWASERLFALTDLSPIFLLAVLLVATRTRGVAAVITALLCFLGWNWFFTDPRYTLTVWAQRDFVNLALFLVVALTSARLAGRLRAQVLELRAANAGIQALQALGRELLQAKDDESVLAVARRALCRAGARAVAASLQPVGAASSGLAPTAPDGRALQHCLAQGVATGAGTRVHADARGWFLPLTDSQGTLGVLRLDGVDAPRRPLLQAMAQDVSEALARTRLAAALEAAHLQSESDRLRSALLSSVSHDLRSPLATIVGAAESLTAYGDSMPPEDRRSLQESILGEGQRLDRYIQNLLDMTRLGHGELKIQRDWIAPAELLGAAARRVRKQFPGIEFALEVASDLPLLWVHPALVEQAVFNILENAARFSPPGGPVLLRAQVDGDRLRIEVADRGPGIPEDERVRIFDRFYSVARGDRGKGGTGLGLSICQGLIGAHGGSVQALPGADGIGTLIVVTLPLATAPDAPG